MLATFKLRNTAKPQKNFTEYKAGTDTKNRTLSNMIHDVQYTVLRRSLISKYRRISRYALNYNFIYVRKKRKVFSSPIFTKLVNAQ